MGNDSSKQHLNENGAVNSNVTVNEQSSTFPIDIRVLMYIITAILIFRFVLRISKDYHKGVKRTIRKDLAASTLEV